MIVCTVWKLARQPLEISQHARFEEASEAYSQLKLYHMSTAPGLLVPS